MAYESLLQQIANPTNANVHQNFQGAFQTARRNRLQDVAIKKRDEQMAYNREVSMEDRGYALEDRGFAADARKAGATQQSFLNEGITTERKNNAEDRATELSNVVKFNQELIKLNQAIDTDDLDAQKKSLFRLAQLDHTKIAAIQKIAAGPPDTRTANMKEWAYGELHPEFRKAMEAQDAASAGGSAKFAGSYIVEDDNGVKSLVVGAMMPDGSLKTPTHIIGKDKIVSKSSGLTGEQKKQLAIEQAGGSAQAVANVAKVETPLLTADVEKIKGDQKIATETDLYQQTQDIKLDTEPNIAEKTVEAEFKAKIKNQPLLNQKVKLVDQAVKKAQEYKEAAEGARSDIVELDKAVKASEDGALTGPIVSRLPSFKSSTLRLENIQSRLGLNVIQNTTFGSLSQAELDFALSSAIPLGLQGPELRKWLGQRSRSQQKLANYFEKASIFLSGTDPKTGEANTVDRWLKVQRDQVRIKDHPKFGNVTEGSIQDTMAETGQTRQEVLNRLMGGDN